MSPRFAGEIDRLAALLRKKPLTAMEIADRTGCSKPTAYVRIAGLRKSGVQVYELPAAGPKRSGPAAVAYGVPPEKKR